MPLEELREARELTQTQLAQVLHVSQGAVSKVEHRADMYISTLRSCVRARSAAICRFGQCSRKAKCSSINLMTLRNALMFFCLAPPVVDCS